MELKNRILARMDELGEGLNIEQINPLMDAHLWDAVNAFYKVCAPVHLTGKLLTESHVYEEYNYVPLPDDYIRVVEVKAREWEGSVYNAEIVNSPLYIRERYKYLQSGNRVPRVFEGQFKTDKFSGHMLKFRGTPEILLIQTRVKEEGEIKPHTLPVLSWFVAGELFTIYGEPNKAQQCYQRAV